MRSITIEVEEFDFFGDTVWACMYEGTLYFFPRHMCEAIGLTWSGQQQKFRDDLEKYNCIDIYTVARDGRVRKMLAIPKTHLNTWIINISAAKVKKECQEPLRRYQAELTGWLAKTFDQEIQKTLAGQMSTSAISPVVELGAAATGQLVTTSYLEDQLAGLESRIITGTIQGIEEARKRDPLIRLQILEAARKLRRQAPEWDEQLYCACTSLLRPILDHGECSDEQLIRLWSECCYDKIMLMHPRVWYGQADLEDTRVRLGLPVQTFDPIPEIWGREMTRIYYQYGLRNYNELIFRYNYPEWVIAEAVRAEKAKLDRVMLENAVLRVRDHLAYYASKEFKTKSKAFRFVFNRCWECGAQHHLQCHHQHNRTFGHESVEDFMTLCKTCHDMEAGHGAAHA